MNNEIKLSYLFKQIHLKFEYNRNKNLEKYNLTSAQMDILVYLNNNKDLSVTQRDLEIALKVKNPTITGILNRLEEKKLINRRKNLNDKRSKIISLTDKSCKIMDETWNNIQQFELDFVKGLSIIEKNDLIRLLKVILKNMEGEKKYN
ncbi:MarR family winged helix-turn-helix transcriptional regulator [Intestinibacter sp.]